MKAPSLVLSDTMTIGKWHILYKLETKIVLTIKISTGYFIFSETFIVVSLKQIKNNRKRPSVHALRDLYFCWENMTCKIVTIRL